jgi:hypothetical protein
MAEAVYLLSAAASALSAGLLLRGFWRGRIRLLLWSGLCFAGLTLNNILLFVDLIIVPTIDLSVWRSVVALAAMSMLLYGLIGEGPER